MPLAWDRIPCSSSCEPNPRRSGRLAGGSPRSRRQSRPGVCSFRRGQWPGPRPRSHLAWKVPPYFTALVASCDAAEHVGRRKLDCGSSGHQSDEQRCCRREWARERFNRFDRTFRNNAKQTWTRCRRHAAPQQPIISNYGKPPAVGGQQRRSPGGPPRPAARGNLPEGSIRPCRGAAGRPRMLAGIVRLSALLVIRHLCGALPGQLR